MSQNDLNKNNILNNTLCGFEFEFFSPLNREDIATSISKFIDKKVIVPKNIVGLNKTQVVYHGEFKPTSSIFKLEPDYSGGGKMHELVTGPLPYKEARKILLKVLTWISKFGHTTEKTSIHLNVSFDKKFKMRLPITHLNPLKFILSFDENFIWNRFPNRKNNLYTKSIQDVMPNNIFFSSRDIKDINPANYSIPNTKYYGINFLKQKDNYLECRYIGGEGYEKKIREIEDIWDYFVLNLYDSLNDPQFTVGELDKLKTILRPHREMIPSFINWSTFSKEYPNLKIFIDLIDNPTINKLFFLQMRSDIFKFLFATDVTKGVLNIDTATGKLQVKDMNIKDAVNIENIEFFNCTFSQSEIIDCKLYRCEIVNSHIDKSKLIKANTIRSSKITKTAIESDNSIYNSYIKNDDIVINGNLYNCIVSSGEIGMAAKLDDETEVVNKDGNITINSSTKMFSMDDKK